MAPTSFWTSDRRLYLDAAGRVVEARDPTRLTLLVIAGGTLPRERAIALGLLAPPEPPPEPVVTEPKSRGRAPANKLRTIPPADKTAAKESG